MDTDIAALCARYVTTVDVILTTNGCELDADARDSVASTVLDAIERACPEAEVDVVWKLVWANKVRLEVQEDDEGNALVSRHDAEEFLKELVRDVTADAYEAAFA